MKRREWYSKLIKIASLTLVFFLFSLDLATASEKEIDINTIPNGYLFKVSNIKPGDWMSRDLVIKNDGKQDFKYNAQVGETKSYKGLFEELELLVKKDTFILFDGKLKDFKGLNPRVLSKGSQETLFFQVTMPYELGNEFQGSATEAEIIFYAEGITNTPPSCEENPSQVGCEQPPSCEEDPSQPGCEQPPSCVENPSQPGCEQPPSCEENPSQPGCEQPPGCEEDPSQPGCEQPPSCEEDSTQPGCEQPPNCEQYPDQDGCEPPDENPEDPEEDTEKPGTGENPTKPDTGNPDVKDVVVIPKDVNRLPNTATNNYNLLLVGGVLLGGGSVLLLLNRRRSRRDN